MSDPVQNLKGFRDFLPAEKRKRDFVEATMRAVFETHGFAPIETPTLEYASLLLGKYGTEADKLVYTFTDNGDRQVGLRYDQTVPTARFLHQYQGELPKYFRRYQIQDVFRADKPQKGRYREFKQCDCDVFGSTSPFADAEVLAVYYAVYEKLGLGSLVIELNDRQTLISTVSPFSTPETDIFSIIQSIDKLDKLSVDEVAAELELKGLTKAAAQAVIGAIENAPLSTNLQKIVDAAKALGIPTSSLVFNPKIARGLDYYTGMIFEGRIPEYTAGSVGGGGRYDHLIENLSGLQMPAIGFAIGFDRTVEAADLLGRIPLAQQAGTQVLVTVFSESLAEGAFSTAQALRVAGIATEVYPELDKLSKQFKLADQKHIPYVVVIGDQEAAGHQIMLKNMATGEQTVTTVEGAVTLLTQK